MKFIVQHNLPLITNSILQYLFPCIQRICERIIIYFLQIYSLIYEIYTEQFSQAKYYSKHKKKLYMMTHNIILIELSQQRQMSELCGVQVGHNTTWKYTAEKGDQELSGLCIADSCSRRRDGLSKIIGNILRKILGKLQKIERINPKIFKSKFFEEE